MGYKVDYHIHSWCSDGTMKPTELVRKYHEEGYDIISITDHDGIDGIAEALIAGEALKIQVVTGVELAVDFEGINLHLLGYQFDHENEALQEKMKELRVYRDERNEKILAALQAMGFDITMEDVKQRKGQKFIGKPNFARALVAKGYVGSVKEAFEPGKFLNAPEIRAIERKKMTAEEAIALMKQAGGMAVLAHPAKIKKIGERGSEEYWNNLDQMLRSLKKMGLKGLECIYPEHTEEEQLKFVVLAGKYHLHITEGSDFHGDE
ncbi:MAG: PHP domain-containing protein [Firmicutes bacterium]|nr:PHP domain-containing protein [Bacillota bacterium]